MLLLNTKQAVLKEMDVKANNAELLREAIAKCQAISKEIDEGIDRLNKGNELLEKLINDMDKEIDRIESEIRPLLNTKQDF